MFQLILFSSVYILVFSGYYVLINFLNIMYPREAFWSFVIFYFIYALSSLLAPFIISKFNFRLIFFLSSFTFMIMIGFSASYLLPLLFIGSAICGFGNGFIWLIQGSWISSYTSLNNNQNQMGLFYTFFNINMIFGNLISLIILITGVSIQIMILSMLAITGLGVLLTLFVKNIDVSNEKIQENICIEEQIKNMKQENIQENIQENMQENVCIEEQIKNMKQETFIEHVKNVFKVSQKCYNIIPCMVYSSVGLNITYQILPRLLLKTGGNNIPVINSIVYIVYGVSGMLFSYVWGKLFDKNWKYVLYSYTILEILCLVGILCLGIFNNNPYMWIIMGAVRGSIDYGINNLINISLSKFSKEDIDPLFGLYRFIYSISYLLSSIFVGYLLYEYVLLICGIICILSTIIYPFFPTTIESQFNRNAFSV